MTFGEPALGFVADGLALPHAVRAEDATTSTAELARMVLTTTSLKLLNLRSQRRSAVSALSLCG
jgi:hypothetical protein